MQLTLMAVSQARRVLARIFSYCFKAKHNDKVHGDWAKETSRVVLIPVSSIDISPVVLQPCAPIGDEPDADDPQLWNDINRLVNAAAAWQIRRVMPVNVAALDESTLVKMTTPELVQRFKAVPVLMVLRADNETLRQLPLELLSSESFVRLTLHERRAIHNVLAERPSGWTPEHLSLYAARERELITAANEESQGWVYKSSDLQAYDSFYAVHLPLTYSTYAQEPRGWNEESNRMRS